MEWWQTALLWIGIYLLGFITGLNLGSWSAWRRQTQVRPVVYPPPLHPEARRRREAEGNSSTGAKQ